MTTLERSIGRARRRMLADLALRRAGAGLAAGLACGVATMVVDRAFAGPLPLVIYAAVAGVGLLAGVIVALAKVPTRMAAAIQLDRQLELKDRMGTAESIRAGRVPTPSAFLDVARLEAERLAGGLDVRRAVPIRLTSAWPAGGALGAALALGLLFMPSFRTSFGEDRGLEIAAGIDPAIEEVQQHLARAVDETAAMLEGQQLDDEIQSSVEELERLAAQMKEPLPPGVDPRQARDETSARLDELADDLDQAAQRDQAALDELAARFAGSPQPDAPMSPDEFRAALERGEFGAAAEILEQLLDEQRSLPAEERERIAGELRDLGAEAVADQDRADAERAQDEDESRLRQALHDQELDKPLIDELMDQPTNPEKLEQALRERDVDEDVARRLAEAIQDHQERRDAREEAQRQAQDVARALEEAAREVESAPQPRPDQGAGEEPDKNAEVDAEGTPGRREGREREPANPPEARPGQGESDRQREQAEQTEREAATDAGREERPQADEATGEAPPRQGDAEQREGDASRPSSSAVRKLRELERLRDQAATRRGAGEQLRRTARELAEGLSDEEKRELARWSEQWERQLGEQAGGGPQAEGDVPEGHQAPLLPAPFEPASTEIVDARGGEKGGRIIAEWLDDDLEENGMPGTQRGPSPVAHARREAERAVNESAVPARYHEFIKRFFGGLEKTVDRAAGRAAPQTPPPPAPEKTPPLAQPGTGS